eukprot:m.178582 g.178582  ORF g.178582 m.178582 type:complete len:132 (+) comp31945_c2_seq13:324-719(+)
MEDAAVITAGALAMKQLVTDASHAIPAHDFAAAALAKMLTNAPESHQVWDVIGLTLKSSRACGFPPALAGVPGKTLLMEAYRLYVEQKGPVDAAATDDEQKDRVAQWTDMSELLHKTIGFMFTEMGKSRSP